MDEEFIDTYSGEDEADLEGLSGRYFNPFLYSDDVRIDKVVGQILKDVKFDGHQANIKNHLRLILLNIVFIKQTSPSSFIRYCRDNGFWSRHDYPFGKKEHALRRMPNPHGISNKLNHVIDRLADEGLLETRSGHYDFKQNFRKVSRFKSTNLFRDRYLRPKSLKDVHLSYHKDYPYVLVSINEEKRLIWHGAHQHLNDHIKRKYEAKGRTKLPRQIDEMKRMLRRYNELIDMTDITLRDTQETSKARKEIEKAIKSPVIRIFKDHDLQTHGRFYNGWWQQISSDLRPHILINGNQTVELDYKSQHAHIHYGINLGKKMKDVISGDAYTIPKRDGSGVYPRSLGKQVFTIALNVIGNVHAALRARLKAYEQGTSIKDKQIAKECKPYLTTAKWRAFYEAFQHYHEKVWPFFFQESWRRYSFWDSQVCEYVLDTLTTQNIPCLSVHDSFIVEQHHKKSLEVVMKEAYTKAKHVPNRFDLCLPPIS